MTDAVTIGTSSGNEAVSSITLGTAAGNVTITAAFLGTTDGNVQVYGTSSPDPGQGYTIEVYAPASMTANTQYNLNCYSQYNGSFYNSDYWFATVDNASTGWSIVSNGAGAYTMSSGSTGSLTVTVGYGIKGTHDLVTDTFTVTLS